MKDQKQDVNQQTVMESFVGHRTVGIKGRENGGKPAMTIRRQHNPLSPAPPLPSMADARATVGDLESQFETFIPSKTVTTPRDTASIIRSGVEAAGADVSQVEPPRVTSWPELWQNTRSGLDHWSPNSRLYQPLAVAAVMLCLLTTAAAATWAPQLRIGSGFAGFTLGVAPIPLRRDERVTPASLIPIYVLSLACTAIFITLQYYNIIRNRGQYLFGTFVLAAHFTGVLSQASDKKLDGIIDLGPAILPAVAALVSLLFLRHQPTFFRYPRRDPSPPRHETNTSAEAEAPQRGVEADIGLEPLTQLSQAATGLMPTGS